MLLALAIFIIVVRVSISIGQEGIQYPKGNIRVADVAANGDISMPSSNLLTAAEEASTSTGQVDIQYPKRNVRVAVVDAHGDISMPSSNLLTAAEDLTKTTLPRSGASPSQSVVATNALKTVPAFAAEEPRHEGPVVAPIARIQKTAGSRPQIRAELLGVHASAVQSPATTAAPTTSIGQEGIQYIRVADVAANGDISMPSSNLLTAAEEASTSTGQVDIQYPKRNVRVAVVDAHGDISMPSSKLLTAAEDLTKTTLPRSGASPSQSVLATNALKTVPAFAADEPRHEGPVVAPIGRIQNAAELRPQVGAELLGVHASAVQSPATTAAQTTAIGQVGIQYPERNMRVAVVNANGDISMPSSNLITAAEDLTQTAFARSGASPSQSVVATNALATVPAFSADEPRNEGSVVSPIAGSQKAAGLGLQLGAASSGVHASAVRSPATLTTAAAQALGSAGTVAIFVLVIISIKQGSVQHSQAEDLSEKSSQRCLEEVLAIRQKLISDTVPGSKFRLDSPRPDGRQIVRNCNLAADRIASRPN